MEFDVGIRTNDAVIFNGAALGRHVFELRRWFPDDADWGVVSRLPHSVGIVLSTRTREISMPTAAKGVTKLVVTQTAHVAWPEGIVKACPVEFLTKV